MDRLSLDRAGRVVGHVGSLPAKLEKEGMVANDVTPAEKQRLAEKLQPVVDKYAGVIGGDWLKRLNEQLAQMRK